MKNLSKRLDLSSKFLQLGQALQDEGDDMDDNGIATIGTLLIFIGGLSLQEEDEIMGFSEIVSNFLEKQNLGPMPTDLNYDDLIAKLNELKDKEDEENSF